MTSTLREQVTETFSDLIRPDDAKLLEECTSICQIYNIPPDNLFYKWEAMTIGSRAMGSEISTFNMDSIVALKAQIQRENAVKPQHRPIAQGSTPMVNRSRIPPSMLKNVQVKMEQNSGVSSPNAVVLRRPAMDPLSRKGRSYRYMYEKISERSEALDDRIDEFGELIREHYKISDLGDPSSSTDEEVTVIGRIIHDSDSSATMSKLTEATIALESSRMLASGARVSLRFDPALKIRGGAQGAGASGLFPGAIVALKGKNGGGGWFLVTEILSLPPLGPSPLALALPSAKIESGTAETPFSMCIVTGPYTPDSDLAYKPWRALLRSIKVTKPAVVLLIGPFIDVQHPKIKNGDIDSTPTSLFRSQFIDPLRIFLDSSPGSIVLVVPSIRDLISRQAVFPQGELSSELSDDPRIHFLPNPARFSINDITFAVTSVDVLYHLKKEEFLKRGVEVDPIPSSSADDTGTDPMANICRHLLQQRSFYPLFPVPLEVSHEVNLSVTHLDGLRLAEDGDKSAPDIMILPSRLKHFSKAVHSTTAVNPSFLIKGSYATINVAARGTGGVRERITTEVVRLEGA